MTMKNKLARLVKAEQRIADFQRLSQIHECALTEHNDQLEYAWKNGYQQAYDDIKPLRDANEKANLMIKKNLQQTIASQESLNADLHFQVQNLKRQLHASTAQFVSGELITQKTGWIVQNWRKGWLWLSNWIFILIAWIAYNGIPPELIAFIPEASRSNVIPILSALGVICRFIDQNRNKPLPVVQATQE